MLSQFAGSFKALDKEMALSGINSEYLGNVKFTITEYSPT